MSANTDAIRAQAESLAEQTYPDSPLRRSFFVAGYVEAKTQTASRRARAARRGAYRMSPLADDAHFAGVQAARSR
jgi:hypothetical protein